MIRIIAVGKKHEGWIQAGLERYQKRLRRPFDIEWVLLPHSRSEDTEAREEESQAILSRVDSSTYLVLLDETGVNIDSPALSEKLEAIFNSSRSVTVVIGGAYGVNGTLMERADFIWSLSKLVFPHQLVRLLLVEQLYRAQEIARGGSYHHI
ncbi:MAG TPA: 23S rRNA (pseudouridine(1915)-N(3))-methyltransferase RlmH [Candidatus Saccharimonadales bacterium]